MVDALGCKLAGYKENKRVAYRWTFEDITDYRNFLPRALLHDRVENENCDNWGLSFFETKESSRERIKDMAKRTKNIYKKTWDTHCTRVIRKHRWYF